MTDSVYVYECFVVVVWLLLEFFVGFIYLYIFLISSNFFWWGGVFGWYCFSTYT